MWGRAEVQDADAVGGYISGATTLFLVFIALQTLLAGKRIGDNPWGPSAQTLEWSVSSPPPYHSYEELPHVT